MATTAIMLTHVCCLFSFASSYKECQKSLHDIYELFIRAIKRSMNIEAFTKATLQVPDCLYRIALCMSLSNRSNVTETAIKLLGIACYLDPELCR